jgi:hypothetical protein
MKLSLSSIAIGAGTASACFAGFLGSPVGFFQLAPIFDMEKLGPFYDWYLFGILNSLSLESRARLVAILELGGALSLLIPMYRNPKGNLKQRIPGLAILSGFFFNSVVGHYVVNDGILPVAVTMFTCSASALVAILFGEQQSKGKKE